MGSGIGSSTGAGGVAGAFARASEAVTGAFKEFKVAVGRAAGGVADALAGAVGNAKAFFTSLFKLDVKVGEPAHLAGAAGTGSSGGSSSATPVLTEDVKEILPEAKMTAEDAATDLIAELGREDPDALVMVSLAAQVLVAADLMGGENALGNGAEPIFVEALAGRSDEALHALRDALKDHPDQPLGMILEASGLQRGGDDAFATPSDEEMISDALRGAALREVGQTLVSLLDAIESKLGIKQAVANEDGAAADEAGHQRDQEARARGEEVVRPVEIETYSAVRELCREVARTGASIDAAAATVRAREWDEVDLRL